MSNKDKFDEIIKTVANNWPMKSKGNLKEIQSRLDFVEVEYEVKEKIYEKKQIEPPKVWKSRFL